MLLESLIIPLSKNVIYLMKENITFSSSYNIWQQFHFPADIFWVLCYQNS